MTSSSMANVLKPTMAYSSARLLVTFYFLTLMQSRAYHFLDNAIIGYPDIICGSDSVQLLVRTKNPFGGKLYVKGDYGNAECSRSYAKHSGQSGSSKPVPRSAESVRNALQCPPCPPCASETGQGYLMAPLLHSADQPMHQSIAQMTVKLGTCHMRRQRTLQPPGVAMSFTAVVSFHEHFVTKIDRAYQIRCFYMETDKTVTSILSVGMPAATELRAQAPMPSCEYTIRRNSPNGPLVRFAKISEQVFHKWQCNSDFDNLFAMLVHSCYVDDGQDQKVMVIDEKGCTADEFLIGDIVYKTPLTAYVTASVFKFADRTALDFQCSVSICLLSGNGCEGITPPNCNKRSRRSSLLQRMNNVSGHPSSATEVMDISAQQIQVIDIDDSPGAATKEWDKLSIDDVHLESLKPVKVSTLKAAEPFCLSVVAFGILVSICTLGFTASAMILTVLYLTSKQYVTFGHSNFQR